MNPSKRTRTKIFDMGASLIRGHKEPAAPPKPVFRAEMFVPHAFQTSVVLFQSAFVNPRVELAYGVLLDMYYVTGYAGHNEFGWLGTVKREGDLLKPEEIFLFEQDVNCSSTDLNPEHIAQVATDLIRAGQKDKVNALKFWGHAHPGNSTSPSQQDDDTMRILANGNEWFLRGIFGRNGRIEFTLFDYKSGLRFNDIPWRATFPESEERRSFFSARVRALARPTTTRSYYDTTGKLIPRLSGLEDFGLGGYGQSALLREQGATERAFRGQETEPAQGAAEAPPGNAFPETPDEDEISQK